jgi:glycerol-3-phosphate dehydrogenase (NAD(P)+)
MPDTVKTHSESPLLLPRIAILGAGTWGWALAGLFAKEHFPVSIWTATGRNLRVLQETHVHPKLPDIQISPSVAVTDDMGKALKDADIVIFATASPYMREVARKAAKFVTAPLAISVTKGLEPDTTLTMTEVLAEEIPEARLCTLSGGSHAEEVIRGLPFALTLAAKDDETPRRLKNLLSGVDVGLHHTKDIKGVEIGAALKNILAIAAGIGDGQNLGDNFRSALVTRGLYEMTRLGQACGCRLETFYEDCCLGDLLATAFSPHSRNRNFGLLIGKGFSREESLEKIGMVVEGLNAITGAIQLGERYGVETPFFETVRDIVAGKLPRENIVKLIFRPRR